MTLLSKAGHALMLTTYARLPEPKVPDYTHVDLRVACRAARTPQRLVTSLHKMHYRQGIRVCTIHDGSYL